MNQNDILSLLSGLGSTPNWQYQLGLAQLQPQEQANTIQYQLGNTQLANQLAEFQQQQALAAAQQAWAQQFQTTGQQEQYGLQSGAQQFQQQQEATQNAIQNQAGNLQNWMTQVFGPMQAAQSLGLGNNAQARGTMLGAGGAGGASGGLGGYQPAVSPGGGPVANLVSSPYGELNLNTPTGNMLYNAWQNM
jgi:hypothetical protein